MLLQQRAEYLRQEETALMQANIKRQLHGHQRVQIAIAVGLLAISFMGGIMFNQAGGIEAKLSQSGISS